jgi:hypothetical protein
MGSRLELQTLLETNFDGCYVYYDPPESVRMSYPAIRFSRKKIDNTFANNSVYKQNTAYELILIYDDPDSDLPMRISRLPMCVHDRAYVADNLHHEVYTLYF